MNTWIVLRAAGIGAYLMLFLSVAWGLASTTSLVTKHVAKPTSILFHQFTASVGLALLTVHLGGVLLDRYMKFHPLDLLIPLRATYRPLAIGVGVVAMYAMVIVLVSSWTKRWMPTSWWRALHLLAVPTFTLTMIHGLFAGTDSARPWMFAIYAGTGLLTLFLVLVRALTVGYRPARREHVPAAPPVRAGDVRQPSRASTS